MTQTTLFADILPFGGKTFDVSLDEARLTTQLECVRSIMSDGRYRTFQEIQMAMQSLYGKHSSEAGISARLRDMRKPLFGGFTVNRRRRGEASRGLWEYQLLVSGPF